MIRDEIMDWLLAALMGCAAVLVAVLVVGTIYDAGAKYGKKEAEAERRERVEYRCWCEEWAETRAAQEAYLERKGGER